MAELPARQSTSANVNREPAADYDRGPHLLPVCNSCNLHEELAQVFDYTLRLSHFSQQYRKHYEDLRKQYAPYLEGHCKERPDCTKTETILKFPLMRGATRKQDVLDYCKVQAEKVRLSNDDITDKESAELLWQLMAMLVDQNGSCIRSDMVELLSFPTEEWSRRGSHIDPPDGAHTTTPTMCTKTVAFTEPNQAAECHKTLCHLLFESSAAEALQYAQRNEMWGHAFLLAQAADENERARLASQFIQSTIPDGDPMKTIFELMLTKKATVITNIEKEKSADWRQHLAAMMSEACDRDVSHAAALNLGDALASKGKAVAALICYFAAQIEQKAHDDGATKLTRALESSSLPANVAEIYKYAMRLGESRLII